MVIIFAPEHVVRAVLWVGHARKCDLVAGSELRYALRTKTIQWVVVSSATPAMLATTVLLASV